MIISNSKKFIFVHIHKTGGSSLSEALQPHLGWNDIILDGSPFGEAMNGFYSKKFGLNKHSTLEEIAAVCGPELVESYFTFALVRNPRDRAASLYNYIAGFSRDLAQYYKISEEEMARIALSGDKKMDHNFFEWSATRAYYLTENFSGFIRHEETLKDMGFRPQIESLKAGSGDAMIDKTLKLEDLALELPALWSALGFRFLLPHANQASFYAQPPSEVSKDDEAYLRTHFAEDYLALEY